MIVILLNHSLNTDFYGKRKKKKSGVQKFK